VRDALSNPGDASNPEASIASTLQTLRAQATTARDGYRDARNAVRSMLARVKSTPPAAKTLEETIAALDQAEANERAAAIDAAEKQAKDEGARKVAEEKVKLAKETADGEAARLANEAAKKKQETDLATARTVEEMKLKQKEADAQINRIQADAEKRRQGDLRTGSKFNGTYSYTGFTNKAVLSVVSRNGDDIKLQLIYNDTAFDRQVNLTGKVTGTTLKLTMPGSGGSLTSVLFRFDPTTKAISGSCPLSTGAVVSGTVDVRLAEEE
jgi:hypothetical protein